MVPEAFHSELTESSQQFVVFCTGSYGDAKTVVTKLYATAVAHDDTFVHQIVINLLGIGHASQEEVGIRLENLLAYREFHKCLHDSVTF